MNALSKELSRGSIYVVTAQELWDDLQECFFFSNQWPLNLSNPARYQFSYTMSKFDIQLFHKAKGDVG